MKRRAVYPLLGLVLAQGAPLGLLVLRALLGRLESGVVVELSRDPVLYAYLSLSTATVMAVLGYALGRVEDKLASRSHTDWLTGLHNRLSFEEHLDIEVARALRSGQPVSLLMLDIDRFKGVNDALGHAAGDRVLHAVGECVRCACRATDIPCRYGGEELAVICPATGIDEALSLAQRMRVGITAFASGAGQRITVSAGVAGLVATAPHPRADFLERADRALYRAKSAGRDRVALDPLLPSCLVTTPISSPMLR